MVIADTGFWVAVSSPRDKHHYDLADASLVLLAEELGHGRILSTDQRHFRTYRWKHRKPFENLLISA